MATRITIKDTNLIVSYASEQHVTAVTATLAAYGMGEASPILRDGKPALVVAIQPGFSAEKYLGVLGADAATSAACEPFVKAAVLKVNVLAAGANLGIHEPNAVQTAALVTPLQALAQNGMVRA